ncbi:MAG: hypothetical protein IJ089_11385, partial [Clostridia bacterium]|nr:hypothetical protein [Clostridia bacterium]
PFPADKNAVAADFRRYRAFREFILVAGTFPSFWLQHSVRGLSCSLFFGPAGPISLKTVHRTVFQALDVPVPFVLPSAFPPTAR